MTNQAKSKRYSEPVIAMRYLCAVVFLAMTFILILFALIVYPLAKISVWTYNKLRHLAFLCYNSVR